METLVDMGPAMSPDASAAPAVLISLVGAELCTPCVPNETRLCCPERKNAGRHGFELDTRYSRTLNFLKLLADRGGNCTSKGSCREYFWQNIVPISVWITSRSLAVTSLYSLTSTDYPCSYSNLHAAWALAFDILLILSLYTTLNRAFARFI